VEKEARVAEKARDGFHRGVITGLLGMALAAFSKGKLSLGSARRRKQPTVGEFYRGRLSATEISEAEHATTEGGTTLHDALMDRCGWPQIVHDGALLVSHQDVLLMGGKVQAPSGYADHVVFRSGDVCSRCGAKLCIEMCSGQALTRGAEGTPAFDREKCVFCGACLWNCTEMLGGKSNLEFRTGAGGLHSAEN
jgi:electron-transferring-flavoprotein dehydrogenase